MTPANAQAAVTIAPAYRRRLPAWLRLHRPHHAPITLSAGIAGMAVAPDDPTFASIAIGALIAFSGYPLGQVVNDYFDREADAVNAPDRPFVTGEVNPTAALAVVAVIIALMGTVAALVAPAVIVWGTIAMVGHAVYSATKRIPMAGNVANGIDLALFALIGAAAARPDHAWHDLPTFVLVDCALIAVVLSGFCLVTYFKDITGDEAVGYRTLPVVLGPRRATWWVIPFVLVGVGATAAVALIDPETLGGERVNVAFVALLALAALALALSIRELLVEPRERAYEALLWYVRGSVLFALALGAVAQPGLVAAVAVPVMAFLEITYRETRGTRQP